MRWCPGPSVASTRTLGVIFAMDLATPMERYGKLRDRLYRHFMERGIYLRPLGNTVYVLPPYIIDEEAMGRVYQGIEEAIELLGG